MQAEYRNDWKVKRLTFVKLHEYNRDLSSAVIVKCFFSIASVFLKVWATVQWASPQWQDSACYIAASGQLPERCSSSKIIQMCPILHHTSTSWPLGVLPLAHFRCCACFVNSFLRLTSSTRQTPLLPQWMCTQSLTIKWRAFLNHWEGSSLQMPLFHHRIILCRWHYRQLLLDPGSVTLSELTTWSLYYLGLDFCCYHQSWGFHGAELPNPPPPGSWPICHIHCQGRGFPTCYL